MDPNENVRAQNELLLSFARASRDGLAIDPDAEERFGELEEALVEWLYYGGFAPTVALLTSLECAHLAAAELEPERAGYPGACLTDD